MRHKNIKAVHFKLFFLLIIKYIIILFRNFVLFLLIKDNIVFVIDCMKWFIL